MTYNHEDYRRKAAMCEERARHAPTSELRADWLRLAAGWLSLISYRRRQRPQANFAQRRTGGAALSAE